VVKTLKIWWGTLYGSYLLYGVFITILYKISFKIHNKSLSMMSTCHIRFHPDMSDQVRETPQIARWARWSLQAVADTKLPVCALLPCLYTTPHCPAAVAGSPIQAKYYTAVVIKSVALWSTRNLQPWKPTLATSTLQVIKFPVGMTHPNGKVEIPLGRELRCELGLELGLFAPRSVAPLRW
jgi:hypothetical protein